MNLTSHKRYLQLLSILAFTILLIACGTATPAEFQEKKVEQEQDNPEENSNLSTKNSDSENSQNDDSETDTPDSMGNGIEMGVTDSGNYYIGNPDAPVVIEEFSDFQCPFCSRFSLQTLPSLLNNQIADGETLLVYYDFPLENIHPQAAAAANAARCAGEQSAAQYWVMHDELYKQTDRWSVSNPDPVFSELASEIGLDLDDFNPCVAEFRYEDQIQADMELAISQGVRSTPSFFINGQPLVGAQPLETFNQAIASVMAGESIVSDTAPAPEQESPLQPPAVKPDPVEIDYDDYAYRIGDPNAPVTIVEFTDYQCPYCQRHALETYAQISELMIDSGTVQYIIKDLPLDSIHPNARLASLAARCAGEQDAYIEMHDAIFMAQQEWASAGDELSDIFKEMANDLSLDESSFASCLDENRHADAIQANYEEANTVGADSTPFFFINGYPIAGAQSFDVFEYAVTLAQAGNLAEAYVPPEPDLSQAFSVGEPDAPVMIIEYTDYQCPFCSRHYQQTFNQIKEQYIDTGQVYYVFKDFPLTNIHPQAVEAAEAARCAGDQGLFLDMHSKLFNSQNEWSGQSQPEEIFINYAEELSLDKETFVECMQSDVHIENIANDLREGSQRGISGTPAFIINGHSMSGAQPYEIFSQAIDQFLGES